MKIQINSETCKNIERAFYELKSIQGLCEFCVVNNIPEETKKYYYDQLVEKNMVYDRLKSQIETEYVKPVITKDTNWSLNFADCEITLDD